MALPMRSFTLILLTTLFGSIFNAMGQASNKQEDISWLAAIAKPELDYEGMTYSWSADSSAVIVDGIFVTWNDSLDATLEGHTVRKAINCQGALVLPNGDSVQVHPLSAQISEVRRIGPLGIYRMVLPIQDASGKPLAERPTGTIVITISAGKLIDRKYSIEGTRQTVLELK